MKIFVLLSRIPYPLEKGDKLRSFHQIRCLSKKHEIVLCALNDDPHLDQQAAFHALQPYCASINFINLPKPLMLLGLAWAFLKNKPLQCGYFYNKKATQRVKQIIDKHKPDMLYCQLVRTAEYIRHIDMPKAIDYQDVLSMGMKRRADMASFVKRPFFNMEYRRLHRYEADIFGDFDIKTIICKADRDLINHPDRDKILVVPNGVDYDYYAPSDNEKHYDLVMVGNMSYAPNVNAVEYMANEILPIVWRTLPNTTFYVAGTSPDPRIRSHASDRIIVSGWLDDIRTAYAESRIFIAPMRIGTGLQNKLLEAMSMRLPCITTPLANASLGAENGKEIHVGKNAEELAQHIITLLNDNTKAEETAQAGNEFVHRVYNWEETTSILEKAILKQD